MGYNVEWLRPKYTEVWSFDGRLYMSKKAAERRQADLMWWDNGGWEEKYPGRPIPAWYTDKDWNIYKINLSWEAEDADR